MTDEAKPKLLVTREDVIEAALQIASEYAEKERQDVSTVGSGVIYYAEAIVERILSLRSCLAPPTDAQEAGELVREIRAWVCNNAGEVKTEFSTYSGRLLGRSLPYVEAAARHAAENPFDFCKLVSDEPIAAARASREPEGRCNCGADRFNLIRTDGGKVPHAINCAANTPPPAAHPHPAPPVGDETQMELKESTMAMTAVPESHPLMQAWNTYKLGDAFQNTKKWAAFAEHVDGSLWAAFEAGWRAATPPPAPSRAPQGDEALRAETEAWLQGEPPGAARATHAAADLFRRWLLAAAPSAAVEDTARLNWLEHTLSDVHCNWTTPEDWTVTLHDAEASVFAEVSSESLRKAIDCARTDYAALAARQPQARKGEEGS